MAGRWIIHERHIFGYLRWFKLAIVSRGYGAVLIDEQC
jgi:hypothetical protein